MSWEEQYKDAGGPYVDFRPVMQADAATAELECARRDAERARAPAAGGQLQRRIAELEAQLAAADAQVQQLTVRATSVGVSVADLPTAINS